MGSPIMMRTFPDERTLIEYFENHKLTFNRHPYLEDGEVLERVIKALANQKISIDDLTLRTKIEENRILKRKVRLDGYIAEVTLISLIQQFFKDKKLYKK